MKTDVHVPTACRSLAQPTLTEAIGVFQTDRFLKEARYVATANQDRARLHTRVPKAKTKADFGGYH